MTLFQQKNWICFLGFFVWSIFNLNNIWANENVDQRIKGQMSETGKDVKRGAKKDIRKLQDKTCEVINGKTKCWSKKVKHSIENEMDKAKDAVK